MKLLSEFRQQIKRLGQENIKQAWFTSFNLSPHFVETYILQALAGSNERMTAVADYEALQLKLIEQGMDIRFFSDAEMIDVSEPKRTSFDFHLVNPKLLGPQFANGVFHPKVIFLRAEDGTAVVGAGSANLTVSGWGRNREAFLFKSIDDLTNRDRVVQFFKSLFDSVHVPFPDFEIKLADGSNSPADWRFLSSLNGDRLFDNLKESRADTLSVWSPFFSQDMVDFKKRFIDAQLGDSLHLEIYPDVVNDDGNGHIRIADTPETRKKLAACNDITFWEMHWEGDNANIPTTHAKLWQIGQRSAIGSWNCTQAGTNVHLYDTSGTESCNVEAGILIEAAAIEGFSSSKIEIHDYLMPAEQLIDEQDALPKGGDRLPFFLEVCFDWKQRAYLIRVKDLPEDQHWQIKKLPGKEGPIELHYWNGVHRIGGVSVKAVMSKRTFDVFRPVDLMTCSGFILEDNVDGRPTYGFENIGDLFDAWNTGKPERKTELHVPITGISGFQSEGFEAIGDIDILHDSSRMDYFRMFHAFQNMHEAFLRRDGQNSDELNRNEIRRLIQTYPGSLWETSEKIKELVGDKGIQNPFTPVFLWILKNEYQSVLKTAQTQADRYGLQIDWPSLSLADLPVRIDGADRKLLALVSKLAGYDECAV